MGNLIKTLILNIKIMVSGSNVAFRVVWSGRRGSNPRHSAWKAEALPLSYSRLISVYFIKLPTCNNRGAKTKLTIDISFINIFNEGPEVSLNGSPTTSPVIPAL